MAHGFLRRLFEVFETLSHAGGRGDDLGGQRLGDGGRRPPARRSIVDGARRVRRGDGRARTWRSCAPSATACGAIRALAIRLLAALEGVPLRMVSQAASRRNVTVVLQRPRRRRGDDAAARRVLRRAPAVAARRDDGRASRAASLLIVGHGRMGRLVESLSAEYGFEVAGRSTSTTPAQPDDVARRPTWRSISRPARRSRSTSRRLAARGIERRDRHDRMAGARGRDPRARRSARGIGVVAAPNFALGVNLFWRWSRAPPS